MNYLCKYLILIFLLCLVLPSNSFAVMVSERLTVADILDSGCLLIWDPVPENKVDSYIVYIDLNNTGDFIEYTRVKKNSIKIRGLKNGKETGFRIATFYNGKTSIMSNKVVVVPEDCTPPEKPNGLRSFPEKKHIKLKWRPCESVDFLHYTIYRKAEGIDNFKVLEEDTGILKPEYEDHKVTLGINYLYAVTATDQQGNESEKSSPVAGHTRYRPVLSIVIDKDKINAYCFNPNNKSVYESYLRFKDVSKWTIWKRTVFHFPNPPGTTSKLKHLNILKEDGKEKAIAFYPVRGEAFLASKQRQRWNKWDIISKDIHTYKKTGARGITYHGLKVDDTSYICAFDHTSRMITLAKIEKDKKLVERIVICNHMKLIPDEVDDLVFIPIKYEKDILEVYCLLTKSKKIYKAQIKKNTNIFQNYELFLNNFILPPNF